MDVTLRDTPPDEEQTPPISELPLGLRVVNAGVQHLRLRLPDAEAPLLIDAIGLDLRWIGRRVELRRLAATLRRPGRSHVGHPRRLLSPPPLSNPLRHSLLIQHVV